MRIRILAFACCVALCATACQKKPTDTGKPPIPLASPLGIFAVFSDPHYMDPDLGTAGDAFEAKLAADRKMLAESEALLEAVIGHILDAAPDFVLIPGDLTKDGEMSSHQKAAAKLSLLEDAGIPAYVVPGNHDINNVHAESYSGSETTPVPSISVQQFESIYGEYGYNEALFRDANSLSYIVEPVEGLWLFCMDACRYEENTDVVVTGGRLKAATLAWIRERLIEANSLGKLVLGLMHHGILEHFDVQADYFPDYVIEDWERISDELSSLGMRAVFTGHFHAQDIVQYSSGSKFLYDIETGSTVTYPCPYRLCTLKAAHSLQIRSFQISNVNYDLGGKDLQTYARDAVTEGLLDLAVVYGADYGLSQNDIETFGPAGIEVALQHLAGDEVWTEAALALLDEINSRNDIYSNFAAGALKSVLNDPPPPDNDIDINLRTGEFFSAAAK